MRFLKSIGIDKKRVCECAGGIQLWSKKLSALVGLVNCAAQLYSPLCVTAKSPGTVDIYQGV